MDGEDTPDSRSDQLHRVLFFWALLNPAGYVQGMSELAAVLLFVFASSDLVEHTQHAEADTFAAFSRLLGGTGMIDIFSAIHDGPQLSSGAFQTAQGTGLGGVLSCLHARIALCDSPLAMHLQREGVQPSYFAIKWLVGCCRVRRNVGADLVFDDADDSFCSMLRYGNSSTFMGLASLSDL